MIELFFRILEFFLLLYYRKLERMFIEFLRNYIYSHTLLQIFLLNKNLDTYVSVFYIATFDGRLWMFVNRANKTNAVERCICHKLFTRQGDDGHSYWVMSRERQKPSKFQTMDFNRWRLLAPSRAWLLISFTRGSCASFLFSKSYLKNNFWYENQCYLHLKCMLEIAEY